jgi:hypothetical protein
MLNGGIRRCPNASKRGVRRFFEILFYRAIENIEPGLTALYGLQKSAKHILDC